MSRGDVTPGGERTSLLSGVTDVAAVAVFRSGAGAFFGFVTLKGSDQIVVFVRHADRWIGCCQFGPNESQGISPGEALPGVAAALDAEVKD